MSKLILGLFFLATIIFVGFRRGKMNSHEFYLSFLVLFFIVIMRSEVMADYQNYLRAYEYGVERFEPIFQIIFSVLHFLSQPSIVFFIVVALATIVIKLKAIIRISDYPRLSILVWMSGVLITQDMIAIRAALAASFMFWQIYYKCNGKTSKAWLMLLLAICSHYSAAILIIIMFISSTNPRRYFYLGILLATTTTAFLGFSVTDYFSVTGLEVYDKLMSHYSGQSEANAFNLVQIARCLICVMLWIIIGRIQQVNKYILLSLKAYTLGCVFFFLTFKLVSVSFRLGELLWTTEILIYPYLVYISVPKYRNLARIIPIGIAIIFFIFNYNNPLYWQGIK